MNLFPYPLTDDGLAYVMSDADKVIFLDAISQELNRLPQCGDVAVYVALEMLRDRLAGVIAGFEEWNSNRIARWRAEPVDLSDWESMVLNHSRKCEG